jgi:hypothetical protein
MHLLIISTFFWVSTFSAFNSKAECDLAAVDLPWYASHACIPFPVKVGREHDHKH